MSRKRKDSCDETPFNSYIDKCVNNMYLFDSFSKKKSEQGMLATSSDHVTSNQFQNNISCKIESDDQENNEPYEIQSDTEDEEQCTKNEDLCVACGLISAYEFFSFPINVDIRQQWAKFCGINLDQIKPHFRLCDGHFKPEDYQSSTQRKVLKPTSVPTLRPKLTLNKNASQNTTCSSNFRRNATTADARNKRLCRDITNNQHTILSKAAKSTSKKNVKLGKFQILEKNLRTDIFRLKIRCSSLEDAVANFKNEIKQQVEECFVTRANTAGNDARDIQNSTSSINASSENSRHNLRITEPRTYQRSVKDALVGSAEQVTEDDILSDSSMPSLEISIDDPQKVEVKPELFTEEVMLDEPTEKTAEDNHSVNSTISPREISTDRLQNAKAILKPFSIRVTNADTSRNVTENNRYSLPTSSSGHSNNSPGSTEDAPAQHFEKVTPSEPENSDKDSQSPNSSIPSSEKLHESRNNAEVRAGCSKNQENSGQVRITRSAKQKKHLPSVKKPTRSSSNVSNKAEVQMEDSLPYCCDICGAKFSHKLDWTRHQHEHTKPFHCKFCDKQFASKSSLIEHGLTHSEKKRYKCSTCDARFKHYSNKLRHERVHSDGARFECDVCGKKFSYKHDLIRHLRVHSGVKPFSCLTCSRSFTQKHHLTRHQRAAHSEARPFECRICNQKFKKNYNRARHERMHVEGPRFECAHCGNKFLSKRTLANHISSKCT